MTSLATKQQLLDSAGNIYNFDREVYFNRSAKKIFSVASWKTIARVKLNSASSRTRTHVSGYFISMWSLRSR